MQRSRDTLRGRQALGQRQPFPRREPHAQLVATCRRELEEAKPQKEKVTREADEGRDTDGHCSTRKQYRGIVIVSEQLADNPIH